MLVSVGDVSARCDGCGGTDFKLLSPGALRLASLLACTSCGRKASYLGLLDAIGEEAMRQANEALIKHKKNGSKRPKPN
jgi:hypothetical protein